MAFRISIYILTFALLLLPVTYFLAPKATASFFPSYLIGLAGIIVIFLKGREIKPIAGTFLVLAGFVASMLFSNHLAGFDPIVTARYLGYAALILTFLLGFYFAAIQFEWFVPSFLIVTVGSALVSSLMSSSFYFFLDYQPLIEKRLFAMGRLNNPVISALSYGSALCLCLSSIAISKERGLRIIVGLVFVALLLAILLTGTRGAWIGLFAAMVCVLFLREWNSRKQLAFSLSILCAAPVVLVAGLAYFDFADAILARSFSFRPEIWTATLGEWREAGLLFGAGIHSVIDLRIPPNNFHHPHSIYLSTLYYGGILGLFLFVALILKVLTVLVRSSATNEAKYALPLLVFGLVTLTFDGDKIIEKVNFLWLCFWLPIALGLVAQRQSSLQRSR